MRTTASLAAFVTLMAVANSNAAPIGAPSGPSARSISRARGQLRSRDVPPMPNFPDVSFTAGVPDAKCEDCREGEARKVSTDVAGPMADMEGGLKAMKNRAFSADVQVPGVPSGSGSIDIDIDDDDQVFSADVQVPGVPSGSGSIDIDVNVGDDEGPDSGASTRPQKQANDSPDANDGNVNDGANDGGKTDGGKTDDGRTDDGRTDDGRTDDGRTDDGQAEVGGKANPPAEQSPCDCAENEVEDMRDEVKDDSKTVDDMARETMAKAEGKSDQVADDAKAASSPMNEGVQEFSDGVKNKAAYVGQMAGDMSEPDMDIHAEVKMDAENRQDSAGKSFKMPKGDGTMPKVVTVSQGSSSESTKDCEDETTVEMQQGNPSVSTSVVGR